MANAILGLYAHTAIHAGASSSSGVIDLPIQREAHTDWPCVYGSGVKGALRAKAEQTTSSSPWLDEVFGPAASPSDHAGAIAVGDARLLLLPVRSLTSYFKWVTCPALLRRVKRDYKRLGFTEPAWAIPIPQSGSEVIVHQRSSAQANRLLLEERSYTEQAQDLSDLITFLAGFIAEPQAADQLKEQLAIVSDDEFGHLARYATPKTAHIAIDNRSKTVKNGALWYEETLPPETILYTGLLAERSRKGNSTLDETGILNHAISLFADHSYLQLGGNETVGMGWCQVTIHQPEGGQ